MDEFQCDVRDQMLRTTGLSRIDAQPKWEHGLLTAGATASSRRTGQEARGMYERVTSE